MTTAVTRTRLEYLTLATAMIAWHATGPDVQQEVARLRSHPRRSRDWGSRAHGRPLERGRRGGLAGAGLADRLKLVARLMKAALGEMFKKLPVFKA